MGGGGGPEDKHSGSAFCERNDMMVGEGWNEFIRDDSHRNEVILV